MAKELFSTKFFSDANLQAYYRLENVNDSKNSFNLSNLNSVAFNTALFNNGADQGSSNTNKALYINNDLNIENGDQSFMGWFNFYSFTAGAMILQKGWDNGAPGTNNQWTISCQIHPSNTSQIRVNVTGNPLVSGNFNHGMSLSTWHHIAVTFKNSTAQAIVYVDGQQIGSFTGNTGTSSNTTNLFIVGAGGDRGSSLPSRDWSSMVSDDVALFNRVLTPSEVRQIYTGGNLSNFFLFM